MTEYTMHISWRLLVTSADISIDEPVYHSVSMPFSEVTVKAVTEFDNKATHGYPPVLKWHRPFLRR